ncbi:MAG: Rieske 2Fe-2S domain-containing protein [Pseudomonadota bacterium]
MRFHPLEKLINLHNEYRREFKIDGYRLLLIQRQDELFLVEALCPHREHALINASFDDRAIVCPVHQYAFSLDSGRVLRANEQRCRGLRTFRVEYEGNEVGVLLEDLP